MQTEHAVTWKGLKEQKQDDMQEQYTLKKCSAEIQNMILLPVQTRTISIRLSSTIAPNCT